MKSHEIILIAIAVLLAIIAVELFIVFSLYNANAKLEIAANHDVLASNDRLEKVMKEVGGDLRIVVDKFCGHKDKRQ